MKAGVRSHRAATASALAFFLLASSPPPSRAQEPAPDPAGTAAEDPGRWARLAAEGLSELEICRPEGAEEDMLCGDLEVWEDREAKAGRKIALHVVVVPAHSEDPFPDPVVVVPGGPGESITGAAPYIAAEAERLAPRRHILLVDQRGTGKSSSLPCTFGVSEANPQPGYDAFFPLPAVVACKEELEKRADLTQYTTSIAVEDLEEVRRRLGFGPLNLHGAPMAPASSRSSSAGTRSRCGPRSSRAWLRCSIGCRSTTPSTASARWTWSSPCARRTRPATAPSRTCGGTSGG